MGDHLQRIVPHQLDRTLAFGKRIVKGDLILRQALFLASLPRRADVLCEIDKFLQHLNCADSVRVIPGDGSFQALGETLRLDDIGLAAGADFIVQELAKSLKRQVLLFELLNLGEKFIGQD